MTTKTTFTTEPAGSAFRLGMLLLLVTFVLAGCGSQDKPRAPSTDTPSTAPTQIDARALAPAYADISPTRSEDLDHPYTSGKIVIVDKGRDDQDYDVGNGRFNSQVAWDLQENGDGDLLADIAEYGIRQHVTNPDQVGTVVWISCSQQFVGSYAGSGGEGYRTDCTATIIDATRNLIVGETTSSLDPPTVASCVVGEECPPHYGGFDHQGFARYLVAQPRKDLNKPIVPAL